METTTRRRLGAGLFVSGLAGGAWWWIAAQDVGVHSDWFLAACAAPLVALAAFVGGFALWVR